jgi:hypothetical protein
VSHDKYWPRYSDELQTDELYVDALEGELDKDLEKDLELWLARASKSGERNGDALELKKLGVLRKTLKDSDDVALPESGAYYENLESRIMGALDFAIETGEVADRAQPMIAETPAAHGPAMLANRRGIAARVGQGALLGAFALVLMGRWFFGDMIQDILDPQKENQIAGHEVVRATQAAAPEVLTNTVISFESDTDLAMEIAARRLVAHRGQVPRDLSQIFDTDHEQP